jgi:hypothetical protein
MCAPISFNPLLERAHGLVCSLRLKVASLFVALASPRYAARTYNVRRHGRQALLVLRGSTSDFFFPLETATPPPPTHTHMVHKTRRHRCLLSMSRTSGKSLARRNVCKKPAGSALRGSSKHRRPCPWPVCVPSWWWWFRRSRCCSSRAPLQCRRWSSTKWYEQDKRQGTSNPMTQTLTRTLDPRS